MKCFFKGKNFVVDDAIKVFTTDKLERHLARMLPEDAEVNVLFVEIGFEKKVEVTVRVNKRVLRAEMVNEESMNGAVDEVVDVLRKQLRRYKDRLSAMYKKDRDSKVSSELSALPVVEDKMDESKENIGEFKVERVKSFAIKPMNVTEALMEIELLGHSFYVFLNSDTDEVNVIYKRRNGSYGLIEPKY